MTASPPSLQFPTTTRSGGAHVERIRRPVHRPRPINVVLIGHTGQVGSALRSRLAEPGIDHLRPRLELAETVNRSQHQRIRNAEILTTERSPTTFGGLVRRLRRAGRPAVVVDCTADARLPELYPGWLERGIGVVTPNKHGLAGPNELYESIHAAARFGRAPLAYSATVGAGLPILSTLARLARSGERPVRIEAVLSGTLSHVFGQLAGGAGLSAAVADAHRRGFTEPDPLEDLSGRDVERKLLIMLREAGLSHVPITREPVVPDDFGQHILPGEDVSAALARLDQDWRERVSRAERENRRWVYLARFDGERAQVGPQQVDADSPFIRLSGAGNLARVTLATDPDTPLEVHGPGAGVAVTASAVMADLAQAAVQLGGA